jgi:hypothetical protein
VHQGVIDQLSYRDEPLAPQIGELLPFPIIGLALLVEAYCCLLRSGLLSMLLSVDVVVDPPDVRPRWSLEKPRCFFSARFFGISIPPWCMYYRIKLILFPIR